MALRSETRDIDGMSMTTTQLPALRSLALMTRLSKIIAPALGYLDGLDLKSDISALGPALAALFAGLDGEQAQALAREILIASTIVIDGRMVALSDGTMIDHAFSGKMKSFLGALKFALEVNYSDFLGGNKGLALASP